MLKASLFLFVIVLASTYTANLASFFTRPNSRTYGPQTYRQARRSTACVDNLFLKEGQIRPFISSLTALPETRENPVTLATGYKIESTLIARGQQYCLDALHSGDADLFVDVCDHGGLVRTRCRYPWHPIFAASVQHNHPLI